jgi:Carboxypeptidase regulatory-like domain
MISGRLIFDDLPRAAVDPKTLRWPTLRLIRDPQIPALPSAGPTFAPPPQSDGSFRLEGVSPGDFRISLIGLSENTYVKSMKLGNADVLDGGLHLYAPPDNALEIVIGTNAGSVQGSVLNARLEPLPNRTVALVPEPRLRHRTDLYRSIATDSSGRFRLQGLTPGSYTMFAWEDVETGAWQDADFIRGYENRGTRVQVKEGVDENIQLTVIP